MDRDGALNAKSEVFRHVFGYAEAPGTLSAGALPEFAPLADSAEAAEISAARQEGKLAARDKIALGILRPRGGNRDPNDLRLGIFLQDKKLLTHPLVDEINRVSKGEAKPFVTGPAVRHAAIVGRSIGPGSSIGLTRGNAAGTLGFFANLRDQGGLGLVSNSHVIGALNRGREGDPIIHPPKLDGGDPKKEHNVIAFLYRDVEIRSGDTDINSVDAAFAFLKNGITPEFGVAHCPQQEFTIQSYDSSRLLLEGDLVKKIGRTTQFTRGEVEATDVDNLVVRMILGRSSRPVRFDHQIAICASSKRFSKPGDSGSLVVREDGSPVGLLFAGTQSGGPSDHGVSYANEIGRVLDHLEIDFRV
ncbi:MAG: hypothetical protein AAGH70_13620 [Pseudomonadota bacterium]